MWTYGGGPRLGDIVHSCQQRGRLFVSPRPEPAFGAATARRAAASDGDLDLSAEI